MSAKSVMRTLSTFNLGEIPEEEGRGASCTGRKGEKKVHVSMGIFYLIVCLSQDLNPRPPDKCAEVGGKEVSPCHAS